MAGPRWTPRPRATAVRGEQRNCRLLRSPCGRATPAHAIGRGACCPPRRPRRCSAPPSRSDRPRSRARACRRPPRSRRRSASRRPALRCRRFRPMSRRPRSSRARRGRRRRGRRPRPHRPLRLRLHRPPWSSPRPAASSTTTPAWCTAPAGAARQGAARPEAASSTADRDARRSADRVAVLAQLRKRRLERGIGLRDRQAGGGILTLVSALGGAGERRVCGPEPA
jgi:hypothetical protein